MTTPYLKMSAPGEVWPIECAFLEPCFCKVERKSPLGSSEKEKGGKTTSSRDGKWSHAPPTLCFPMERGRLEHWVAKGPAAKCS